MPQTQTEKNRLRSLRLKGCTKLIARVGDALEAGGVELDRSDDGYFSRVVLHLAERAGLEVDLRVLRSNCDN